MQKIGTRKVKGSQLKERVIFKSRILPGFKATRVYVTAYKVNGEVIRKYRDYADFNEAIDSIHSRVERFSAQGFTFKK